MSLTLPLKVAVGSSLFTGGLSAVASVYLFRAYQQFAPVQEGMRVEWSGFVVPFVMVTAHLAVSAVGFFGVLLGPARHARAFGFSFAVGVVAIAVAHWVAIALGVLHFPGLLGLAVGLLGLAWFGGLAFALRPNYSVRDFR
jgi:hypothetical protein